MPIYKRCDKCRKQLPSGTKCDCVKMRHKEYDRYARDKNSDSFYHSKEWKRMKQVVVKKYFSLDIYSYYILGKMEYGEIVHHITPVKEDWNARLAEDNLVFLTSANHNIIHRMLEKDPNGCKALLHGLKDRFEMEFYGNRRGRGV